MDANSTSIFQLDFLNPNSKCIKPTVKRGEARETNG